MAIEGLSFDVPTALPAAIIIVISIFSLYYLQIQKINEYYINLKYYDLVTMKNLIIIHCSNSVDIKQCIERVTLNKLKYEIRDIDFIKDKYMINKISNICGNNSVFIVFPIYSVIEGNKVVIICEKL